MFFQELELWDNLDIDSTSHIWLLHHLFLPAINMDAQDWAGAWNNHVVELRGERSRTPRDMFFFGMLYEGDRGLDVDLSEQDIAGYGVDWEALDDQQIRNHHDNTNAIQLGADDETLADYHPFGTRRPEHFSVVEVEEPNCPMTPEQVFYLDSQLATYEFAQNRTIESYRLQWIAALALCAEMFVF